MAETKQRMPLLMDELSTAERVMLAQVVHHGGFKVLDKLYEAVLLLALMDMAKLDPEESEYMAKVASRTQRTRNFNECIKTIRDSVEYHLRAVKNQDAQEEKEAVDAVGRVFGIHAAKPKTEAIPS